MVGGEKKGGGGTVGARGWKGFAVLASENGFSKYSGIVCIRRTQPPAIRHPGSMLAFGDIHVTKLLFWNGILRKSHFPTRGSGKPLPPPRPYGSPTALLPPNHPLTPSIPQKLISVHTLYRKCPLKHPRLITSPQASRHCPSWHYSQEYPRGIHFRRSHPAPGTQAGKTGKGGWRGRNFCCCVQSAILLMKW